MATLDEWVNQYPRLAKKTRVLWKAIRWEFEEQGRAAMTVRQMFYRMSSAGEVAKTEAGYKQVQRALLAMRRAEAIPYAWISDNTRWVRRPTTYNGLDDALNSWQRNYRRSLWREQPFHVEIWIEKDALAGVFVEVTDTYDVPLYVTRGYASETYLQEAARQIKYMNKPVYIYHFGDFDPSGRDAARHIKDRLTEFGARFEFVEAAVTEQQIVEMQLQTRPTKKSDSRAEKWHEAGKGQSVELDAIPPLELRGMVRGVIERHIDPHVLEYTRRIEAAERARIKELASSWG